jgi:anti-sigma factor RsiW
MTVWSCVDVAENITAYMVGEISAAKRMSFEEHVVICPPCRGFMTQLRTTRTALRGLPREALSPELELHLLRAFRGWREKQ